MVDRKISMSQSNTAEPGEFVNSYPVMAVYLELSQKETKCGLLSVGSVCCSSDEDLV